MWSTSMQNDSLLFHRFLQHSTVPWYSYIRIRESIGSNKKIDKFIK